MPEAEILYQCPPHVSWSVEPDGLCLLDEASGRAHFLAYPEAAAWDLLSRGYHWDAVGRMMEAIASLDRAESVRFLSALLKEWLSKGLVSIRPGHE